MHPSLEEQIKLLTERVEALEKQIKPKKPRKQTDRVVKHKGTLIWDIKDFYISLSNDVFSTGEEYLRDIKLIADKTSKQFTDYTIEQLELEIKNRLIVYHAWCMKNSIFFSIKGAVRNWMHIPQYRKEVEVNLLTLEDICTKD